MCKLPKIMMPRSPNQLG